MLWATLDQNGNLTIEAHEPIEAFALKQWEKQRAAGKAKLIVQSGTLFSMERLCKALKTDIVAFEKWKTERKSAILLLDEETAAVESLEAPLKSDVFKTKAPPTKEQG